jgi:eukaryotic-like serine/threonine-protein kinase
MVNLREGERVGRYRVGRQIGVGGFAKVYRGVDTRTRRAVALKVPAKRVPDAELVEDFQHEAQQNRKLRHPYVLRVLDLDQSRGFPILVTPLGRGSLADRLGAPISVSRALRYGRQLLLALAHAHEHHVLHCDVKPENLVLLANDRLALSDFGTARRGGRTVHGDGAGTAGYMAPEQAAGRPSARSDVFSAGVVLAEMLLGPRWKDRRNPRRSRLPPDLVAVLDRAVDPEPSRRYRDARAMLLDLRRVERRLAARRRRRSAHGPPAKKRRRLAPRTLRRRRID